MGGRFPGNKTNVRTGGLLDQRHGHVSRLSFVCRREKSTPKRVRAVSQIARRLDQCGWATSGGGENFGGLLPGDFNEGSNYDRIKLGSSSRIKPAHRFFV